MAINDHKLTIKCVIDIGGSMFVMLDTPYRQKKRSVLIHDQIFESSTCTSILFLFNINLLAFHREYCSLIG